MSKEQVKIALIEKLENSTMHSWEFCKARTLNLSLLVERKVASKGIFRKWKVYRDKS